MKKTKQLEVGEKLFTWILMAFCLFILFEAFQISRFSSKSSPGSYPMFAAAVMVISLIFIQLENRKSSKPDVKNLADELKQAVKKIFPRVLLIFTGIIILYMLTIQPLGFLISSYLFLLFSIIFLKGSTVVKSLFISGFTLVVIYIIFHTIFTVVLP